MSFLSIFARALQSWPTVRLTLLPKIHSNSKSVGLLFFPGSQSLYTSSGIPSAGDLQRCLQFFIALLGLFSLMQMLLMVSDSKSMTLFISLSLLLAPVVLKIITIIERFHSRDQHLCKFIGRKESIYIRKEFNSHRIGLEHQYGHHDVMYASFPWVHNASQRVKVHVLSSQQFWVRNERTRVRQV